MRIGVLSMLGLLAACSTMNMGTAAKMARLDLRTTDPGSLAMRVQLPEGVAVPAGGAVVSLFSERTDTGDTLDARYAFVDQGGVWRLAPQDVERMKADRATVMAWEAEAPKANSGGMSFSLTPCLTGEDVDPNAAFDVELSMDGGVSFLPFITDATVEDALKAIDRDGMGGFERCTSG